jgi:hypothetical protein
MDSHRRSRRGGFSLPPFYPENPADALTPAWPFGLRLGCCCCDYFRDSLADRADLGAFWYQTAGAWTIDAAGTSTPDENARLDCLAVSPAGPASNRARVTVTATEPGDRPRIYANGGAQWAELEIGPPGHKGRLRIYDGATLAGYYEVTAPADTPIGLYACSSPKHLSFGVNATAYLSLSVAPQSSLYAIGTGAMTGAATFTDFRGDLEYYANGECPTCIATCAMVQDTFDWPDGDPPADDWDALAGDWTIDAGDLTTADANAVIANLPTPATAAGTASLTAHLAAGDTIRLYGDYLDSNNYLAAEVTAGTSGGRPTYTGRLIRRRGGVDCQALADRTITDYLSSPDLATLHLAIAHGAAAFRFSAAGEELHAGSFRHTPTTPRAAIGTGASISGTIRVTQFTRLRTPTAPETITCTPPEAWCGVCSPRSVPRRVRLAISGIAAGTCGTCPTSLLLDLAPAPDTSPGCWWTYSWTRCAHTWLAGFNLWRNPGTPDDLTLTIEVSEAGTLAVRWTLVVPDWPTDGDCDSLAGPLLPSYTRSPPADCTWTNASATWHFLYDC